MGYNPFDFLGTDKKERIGKDSIALAQGVVENKLRETIRELISTRLTEGKYVYAIVDKFDARKQDYDQVYFKDSDLKKVQRKAKSLNPKLWDKYGMTIIKVDTKGKMSDLEEGGKGSGRKAKPGSAKDIENKAMSAADAANAKMDAAEKAMKKKKKKKNEGKLSEAKKVKYKANDWKKINKIAKKKDVMIQSAFGDEFKWEEGSRHGVFASESNGREIELTHDDIDVLVIESKLSEATIRLSRDRDAAFHGNIMQLIGKKHKMGMDKKSVKALFKAISQYMRMTFEQVKLTEGKSLTLPNGIKVKIGMDGLELKDSGGRIKLDRKELEILGRAAKKQMGVRESLTKAFKSVWKDVNQGLASQAGDHEDDEDEDNDDKAILHGIKEGMNKRKAAEILKQIGGNRFIAMTGAKGFAFSDKYMSFKIGRNSKGINFVRIGHNAKDLYDMEFGFVSVKGIKVKKKVKDVYADMLGTMFKKYTGMNVRL